MSKAKAQIGDAGTEQFAVAVVVDGKTIKTQPIHDPFICNTTVVGISRWDHFRGIFKPREIRVEVIVRGSQGAERAIMTLDPLQLAKDTEEILYERQQSRESSGIVGFFKE